MTIQINTLRRQMRQINADFGFLSPLICVICVVSVLFPIYYFFIACPIARNAANRCSK